MATQRFRIGNNLAIQWLLYENDGNIHNIEGKELEVYMVSGGNKFPVKVYTVTENAIAWTFLAGMQTKTGYYKLVLLERDPVNGLYSFDVHEAFELVSEEDAEKYDNVIAKDSFLQVSSVLTYAHITNLASVDEVVTSDGRSKVVKFTLTNGKTFTIPFVPGSGSGGGDGGGDEGGDDLSILGIVVLESGYFPAYESGEDLYYFEGSGNFFNVPFDQLKEGDFVWYFGDPGFLWAWQLTEVERSPYTASGWSIVGRLVTAKMSLFPILYDVIDDLYSDSTTAALSANMGKALRTIIENHANTPASETTLGHIKLNYPESGNNYAVKVDGKNRAYVTVPGGGGGSDDPDGGTAGRSITGTDLWYKLTADESVQATPMGVGDPSSVAGGQWSLTAGNPTVQYPYLRAFLQVNYDSPLDSGYTYTRSGAFTARYFNSDSSADYQDLVRALAQLRTDLFAELGDYDAAMTALNAAIESLRSTISGTISNQLNDLNNRLNQINGTDVEEIKNNAQGLWGVMTSWVSETGDKKAFADIIANAQDAKITLQTGSTFFDHIVGGDFTLDGILGQLAARLTRQDVSAMIASAQFSVDPSSLNAVISKSQACWKNLGDGLLYPYDLYLLDFMSDHAEDDPPVTLSDYEDYMTAQTGGPDDGPFELVVVVEQFSAIQQTVDEISASVDETKYMWQKGAQYASYNSFVSQWDARSDVYSGYTYDQYVTNVLGYTKVEVGSALSNITQKSDEIKLQLGDMGYFWRRATNDGYEYQMYAVPSNKTRDQYVTEMQAAGWSRITYASKMSIIDQFPDSITALVKNSTNVWIDSDATGEAYCRSYDYWLSDYNETLPSALTYEEYVRLEHPSYALTLVTNSFSRIKQTADAISSAVSSVEGFDNRISAIEQTAGEIELSVTKSQLCWVNNSDGTMKAYLYFMDAYETYKESASNPLDYEDWVENTKNHSLDDSFHAVSGVKIQGDKIWAGVGDGNDLKASIEIIANADVDAQTGSKIILDATNVQINGGLQVGVVDEDQIVNGAITSTKIVGGAITTGHLAANAVTADKIAAGAITASKISAGSVTADKIAAGAITAEKIATGVLDAAVANVLESLTVGEYSSIVLEDGFIKVYDSNGKLRIKIGQGANDDSPVLWFYGPAGESAPLYDLGPEGIRLLGVSVYPETWVPAKFWKFNSLPSEGQTYSQANGTPIWLNQYTCARRTVNNVVEYYANGSWQNSASPYDGKYFDGLFTYPADGYYVMDNLGWANHGSGKRATVIQFSTSGGSTTYRVGHMDLTNIDQQAGTSGTVDEIKWD